MMGVWSASYHVMNALFEVPSCNESTRSCEGFPFFRAEKSTARRLISKLRDTGVRGRPGTAREYDWDGIDE